MVVFFFFGGGGGEESCQLLNCEIKPSYRGIKIGPTMEPEEIVRILDSKSNNQALTIFLATNWAVNKLLVVNPDKIPGKVTLIGRYGAAKVDQFLPKHIDAVLRTDHPVVWQCDAMHGK